MPRLMEISAAALATCAATLAKQEVVIPDERLRDIIMSEPTLVRALKYYPAGATCLDTYDRGYLSMAVAKSVGWDDWPVNMDSSEEKGEFLRCLCDAGYIPGLTRAMLDQNKEVIP